MSELLVIELPVMAEGDRPNRVMFSPKNVIFVSEVTTNEIPRQKCQVALIGGVLVPIPDPDRKILNLIRDAIDPCRADESSGE